MSSLSKCKKIS